MIVLAGSPGGSASISRLLRILPMRWISRLAALVMVVMAAVTLGEAIR